MIEDKLSKEERIRLEALSQANMSMMHSVISGRQIIDRAKEFESYIKGE